MADEPKNEGLAKLKISKKAYIFEIKKKYSLTRNFLLKKSAETPLEQLREAIGLFLKKPKQEQPKEKPPASAKPKGSLAFAAALTAAAVLIAFIFFGAIFVMWQLGNAEPEAPFSKPASFSGTLDFSIKEAGIISAGTQEKPQRQAYLVFEYAGEKIKGANISFNLFENLPPTQVFLLDYARDSADNYPAFKKRLFEELSTKKIPISEIGIDKIGSVPEGSIIIVPTGYLPKEFFGIDSSFDFRSILSRGSSIIYIGLEPTRLLDKTGSTISFSTPDMVFKQESPKSTDGFQLFDAQYTVSPGPQSSLVQGAPLYGSVSVLCFGKGCMMFLPQNLDGGWRGNEKMTPGEVAANDIARMVLEKRWMKLLSGKTFYFQAKEGERRAATIFSDLFNANSAYAEVIREAYDKNGLSDRSFDVFKIEKKSRGELFIGEGPVLPYYLSGQLVRLKILLNEADLTPVKLFVRVYKDSQMLQSFDLELGLTVPDKQKSKDIQLDVAPGNYLLRVVNSLEKPYAEAAISVSSPSVAINGSPAWDQGKFVFFVSSEGQVLMPRSISVSMDGKYEKRYSPSTYLYLDNKPYIVYEYPEKISPGVHNFTFTSGSWSFTLSQEYRPPRYMWDDPLVVFLGLLSALIFGIAQFIRRPEVVKYGLDIPDFPPQTTIKIPLKRETVLQIFNDVNTDFAWKWMPLRLDEIKSGFRRLTYMGKPILIGDFNLERILHKLKEEGLVKEELGYWGLSSWEKESRHSMLYLAIYRIMRNVFVNNAVKFSKLDSAPDCDAKAIVGKDEKYFHIMEGEPERVIHRALATAKKGTTIIVFPNEEKLNAFKASLVSTSKLAIALKMEMQNGQILLMPVKNAISAYLKSILG